jgi:hypothetical protein
MAKDEDRLWDPDDAVGYGANSRAHHWAHEWMFWLSAVLALAGVLGFIGAVRPFSVLRVVGALAILAGIVTLRRSDRASRTDRALAASWFAATLALAVGGAALFALAP